MWPQSPQWVASVRRSAQVLPQVAVPAGQAATQVPPEQSGVPAPQTLEHDPQCCGSSSRLTLCCPQLAMPNGVLSSPQPANTVATITQVIHARMLDLPD
jgi:hypothetical protein